MRVESVGEEGSVVSDESNGDEESEEGSSEKLVVKSGTLVGLDKSGDEKEVEGSIVMEESKGSPLLELGSVGKAVVGGVSVRVGEGSPDVGVGVSNVPVLDGNASVTVRSSVSVGVDSELTSKGVESGVDVEKLVGVSVENVEDLVLWRDLVKNGGIRPEKLKGVKLRAVSSSSLMEGVGEPQQ
jgi:hypothetical protein